MVMSDTPCILSANTNATYYIVNSPNLFKRYLHKSSMMHSSYIWIHNQCTRY